MNHVTLDPAAPDYDSSHEYKGKRGESPGRKATDPKLDTSRVAGLPRPRCSPHRCRGASPWSDVCRLAHDPTAQDTSTNGDTPMTLLSRLYTYRATEARSPTEDFLSEAFCEWLVLAAQAGIMDRVLRELLQLPASQCPPAAYDFASIRWSTQHRIGPGYRGTGKRPDLVGQGKDFFLLIENKIGAGFTQHEDEDGSAHQLALYHDYQQRQDLPYGGTVLLTHHTLPPPDWTGPVLPWTRTHRWLVRLLETLPAKSKAAEEALKYWTRHLIAFIEENQMNGTRIALSDLIAIPAYERLQDGMRGLGLIARKVLIALHESREGSELKVPHGGTSGDFNEPNFFGALLTPSGFKADKSSLIVWLGVLAKEAYEITPHIDGIPELSVGIALWTTHRPSSLDCASLPARISQEFAALTPNMNWEVGWLEYANDDDVFVLVARTSLSLIELHQQTGENFWDDAAQSFLSTAGKALLGLPAEVWEQFRELKS